MITVQNLEFQYQKSQTKAIKGISFDIHKGEVFGFLGPSGSGKTTTQRLLIGLLKGYQGSIHILSRERREWGREFFEKVGVAFDFPNLYLKLTAYENLKVIGAYYKNGRKNYEELLERVGLLPYRDQRVEGFSKGMKMRLNFIRSLLHEPELLFFDEPTSGLDPVNAKVIKDIILELKSQGKTVFLTTHNMTVAEQLCDRVAFLVDGRIPVCDSPANLKLQHGRKLVKVGFTNGDELAEQEFPLDNIGHNAEFLKLLAAQDIKTLHSQEASLEEIFIKLTGRELV
ncbi:MAG: ABC transporter ATP-binding protein [Clostridia bacterium]|nr:ABC transporter ATP-binding protein [Clostridia bacterium]